MKGEIEKWFDEKGFGFVKGKDEESYFLHISQMEKGVLPKIGDNVKFEAVETDKGKQAHRVMIL